MGAIRELAERAWSGDLGRQNVHPGRAHVGLEELGEGLAFMSAFSNALVLDTGEGLVFVDTSSLFHANALYDAVREWSAEPVHTGVYTHGHVDHVFGLVRFHQEAEAKGRPPIRVVAHERCPERFDRYRLTQGYNGIINQRQFGFSRPLFPGEFRYPDETVRSERVLEVGRERIELHHDRGETDDHLWAWLPERRVLYTGDLFIWASPNCGNPQKVQRYPREWAHALRRMHALGAEQLLPGHGPPILGRERVERALRETAELLESLVEQTLEHMNRGAPLEEVTRAVRPPAALLERPYLRPIYDDPAFVVRNLWRLYGGWYDGNPAHLLPPREAELGRALADLAGGARRLADEAERRLEAGEAALAASLAELAWAAEPEDPRVRAVRAAVYRARADAETSLMAKGIFGAAAREAEGSPREE